MQAALALSPGDAVKAAYSANPTGDEARRYTEFATDALTIAVFEILIAGTLGTLLIRFFAPLLLDKVRHLLRDQILPRAYALCIRRFYRHVHSNMVQINTVDATEQLLSSLHVMLCQTRGAFLSLYATSEAS